MSHYRKIDTRIWNDEKFQILSDDGKLVFFLVLTHPHLTALGAMRSTLAGLAAELGWPSRRFQNAIAPMIDAGMIQVNDTAAYVGLPNFLRYNEPESPNVVKGAWPAALEQIPACVEKRALILRGRKYLDGKSELFKKQIPEAAWEAFSEASPEGFPQALRDVSPKPSGKPCRNQEPEQEQEQEQEKTVPPPPAAGGVIGFEEFWSRYPRKQGKEAARKAWTKLKPDAAIMKTIHAALAVQTVSSEWRRDNGRFIPHPATWLNGKRWTDQLSSNGAGPDRRHVNDAWADKTEAREVEL